MAWRDLPPLLCLKLTARETAAIIGAKLPLPRVKYIMLASHGVVRWCHWVLTVHWYTVGER